MSNIETPKFNYIGMERAARRFLMKVAGIEAEEVAIMLDSDVQRHIVAWCENNNYHVVQESECVTLAPDDAVYYYLER